MKPAIKQPFEDLTFDYDFGAAMGGEALHSIVSVTAEARGDGAALVRSGQSIEDRKVLVAWSGGSDGEVYLTTVRVAGADGGKYQLTGEICVIEPGWTMPDGGAPYLSIAEFVEMHGLEEVVRMTDDGSGRIDRAFLVGKLRAAQSFAELHIAARYRIPLAEVPDAVKTAIGDIALARLYRGDVPQHVAAAAQAAQRMIEQIGQGKVPLPTLTPAEAVASSSPVVFAPGRRAYPDGLKDY